MPFNIVAEGLSPQTPLHALMP